MDLQCDIEYRQVSGKYGDLFFFSFGERPFIQGDALGQYDAGDFRVLRFPMTVTQTLPAGALLMAMLRRSQQKMVVISRSGSPFTSVRHSGRSSMV